MSLIVDILESTRAMHDRIAESCTMRPQHTVHGFVLTHGREMIAQPRPVWCERGTPKECFSNATHLSIRTGLTYVEGFVVRADIPIPILHGWCVDDDNTVVDPTIDRPEECEYYGIPINSDFLQDQMHKSGMYGILDNYKTVDIYQVEPITFLE